MPVASSSSSGDCINFWKLIWQIPTPPKIRMFMWRICNNAIATFSNPFNRKCAQSPACQICFQEAETTEHMLFGCAWTAPVWLACSLSLRPSTVSSLLHSIISHAPSKNIALHILAAFAFTSWAIWKSRNAHIFENMPINPNLTHSLSQSFSCEFSSLFCHPSVDPPNPTTNS